jgi:tripartite-type tricarboxylate transporter receptor subunit TctC
MTSIRDWLRRLACVLLAGAPLPALADPVEDFYRGKQITMILSAGAGGGYAFYMQAFAPFFTKYIPGHPNIVLQNMPGAGGIRAMMFLNSAAPKDGTTLGFVHSSVPFAPLYGIKGATFDPRKMQWIGSINTSTAICVSWAASGVTSAKDLYDKTFIVGGTGAGSQMETMPAMLAKLFGMNIKIISGYTGGSDVYLAMERGEVHGRCGGLVSSIRSTRPDWFPEHKIAVPIVVALQRNPLFPDTPAVAEFAKDERTKQILKLILSPLGMDRPMLAPPGAPADRVAALRKAFHQAMNDPDFIAEAKRLDIEIDEASAEDLHKILDDAFNMPPDIVKAANDAMNLTGSTSQ